MSAASCRTLVSTKHSFLGFKNILKQFSRKPSSSLDYSFTITLPVEPQPAVGPAHPGNINIGITRHLFLSQHYECKYEVWLCI